MLLAFVGITGVGKSFLAEELSKTLDFKKVHTIRTRKMRPGEINGKTGYFMSVQELEELKKQGKIIYDFQVFDGTYAYLKEEILSKDNYVFEMHYTTIKDWKKVAPNIVTIYLLPKDINMAIKKLKERELSQEKEEDRLQELQEQYRNFMNDKELQEQFDYIIENNYDEASKQKILQLVSQLLKNARKIKGFCKRRMKFKGGVETIFDDTELFN